MGLTVIAVAIAALAAAVGLTELVIRRTDVGAGVVLGLFLFEELAIVDPQLPIGPITIYPIDLLFAVLVTAATARLLRMEHWTIAQRLLVALGAILAWSILRGIGIHEVASTFNESRRYLGFIASALYFSTMDPRQDLLERIARMWVWIAIALCALTVLRWSGNAVGIVGGLFGSGGDMRVLPSDAALIIGQGAMFGVPAMRRQAAGLWKYVTPTLLVFVILLQHRTVWAVVAVGVGYLLIREAAITPRVVGAIAVGLIVFAVLNLTVLEGGEGLTEELADSATRTDTFAWRVAGWQALITDSGPETVSEALLGQPPGGGWERRFDGITVDVSPHNFYLELFLRIGLLGLAVTLALYAMALLRPRERPLDYAHDGLVSWNVLTVVIGVQLLYFVTYTPNQAQAMLLGLGLAFVATDRARQLSLTRAARPDVGSSW